ncbi:30S ribosomal protein S8 [Candidatus Saccharibacteria bacterium]|jgi:small subunit ribosomal protein S8|nr:30S ribosomal protein S8 [Candidatus Saccharibacteria bacterium]MBP9985918.1 30S ribosomal protein S8 [Candidatus Saccharibacteria bacterium]
MSLQSTDPIADLLTRIRNAVAVGKNEITVPSSKMKLSVLEELKKSKYIKSYKVESAKPRDIIVVEINKAGENSVINKIERLSKPGRRVYVKSSDIPKVKNGRGIVLVSTSQGVMTGFEARKNKIGGELLLSIY